MDKEKKSIKVNLTLISVTLDFEGHTHDFTNYNQYLGNCMKYGNNNIFDIGWEECARRIYLEKSGEPVEIEKKYIDSLIDIVKKDEQMPKALKYAIIELLTKE